MLARVIDHEGRKRARKENPERAHLPLLGEETIYDPDEATVVEPTPQLTSHGFSTPFFFAIASRETNCINELGDFQHGEFHGVGIVQIDIQHPIARQARDNGTWKTDPDPLIDFGAQILADNINKAKQAFPNLSAAQQLKIAASGYNCGMKRAIMGAQHGDSDKLTTGKDYGRDVMTRMAVFEELIAEGN